MMDPTKLKSVQDENVAKIRKGFKINSMNISNFTTKEVFWTAENCANYHDSE